MPGEIVVGLAILAALGGFVVAGWLAMRSWVRFHGRHVVVCPSTRELAAVDVDSITVALTAPYGHSDLRIRACSRWDGAHPECAQACTSEIEAEPEGTRLHGALLDWQQARPCAACGRRIGLVARRGQEALLLAPNGRVVEWDEVPGDRLVETLATHQPLCRSCHAAGRHHRPHAA